VDYDVPNEVTDGEEDDGRFVALEHGVSELLADFIGSVSPEEVVLVHPVDEDEGNDDQNGGFRYEEAIEVDGVGEDHIDGVGIVEVEQGRFEFFVEFDLEGVDRLRFISLPVLEAV
jgi:hypothetical protein